jgi:superfamily II DNA or RNA helicase
MDIIDFLPSYTEFDKDVQAILGSDLVDTTSLYHKKEFHDVRLQPIEKRPEKTGEYMNHQIIMARFLSSYTPYNGILVMHEPGTGKTCASVAVIEKIRSEKSSFRGALILMKGKNLIENYKKELVEKCTDGKYKIKDDEDGDEDDKVGYDNTGSLTANKVRRRINKKLAEFYQFQTFETFSKQLSKMSDQDIIKNYSNIVIVIDEAHHLRVVNDKGRVDEALRGQYSNIHRLLHLVKNTKTILMTGTPMIDSPSEIASLMNLILGMDKQLPTGKLFEDRYMVRKNGNLVLDPKREDELKNILHGKVSFLRSMQSSVKREFIGEKLDLQYFNQYALDMKPYQKGYYKNALQKDRDGKGIYINSREASLFVYPDGTCGSEGFKKYTTVVRNMLTNKLKVSVDKKMLAPYSGKTLAEKLDILSTFSIKYATCIKLLLESEGSHFVYMDFVQGSGAIIFAELLKEFGFSHFKTGGKGPKFALLTSKTSSDINDAIRTFNEDSNVNGSKIKVIIGTKIISEGFTLKNVRHVHILTPHWNFSETDQAIARAFRLFSHNKLLESYPDIVVKIYLYTTVIEADDDLENSETFLSIDRYMYKFCEDKDISIKSIEHLLKVVSFDCKLNKERNQLPSILDNLRNCEYQTCAYTCFEEEEEEEEKEDTSTYHLFYSIDDQTKLIDRIKRSFDKKYYLTLQELQKACPDIGVHLLIQTILYIMDNKVIIKTINGLDMYLHYSNNLVYLTFQLYDSNMFDIFYTSHIPLQFQFNFNKEIDKLYGDYLPILFNLMRAETVLSVKKNILSTFSENAKELMLEIAILSREKGYKDSAVDPIRAFLLQEFNSFVFRSKDTIVSTLLGKKNYRCLKGDKKWEKCPLTVEKPVVEQKLNEYGYEGLYDEKGRFKIKEQQQSLPSDTRKVTKGKRCDSCIHKNELLFIIHTLKINPPEKYKNKQTDVVLKEELRDNKDIDDRINIDKLDTADLVRLVYWLNEGKKTICDAIEKKFIEKEMMIK